MAKRLLNILTFNCQKAYQPTFKPFIEELLNEKEFDFLLLQEVNLKALEILKEVLNQKYYGLINTYNPATSNLINICIVYNKKFQLEKTDFLSFNKLVLQQLYESGSLSAIFHVPRNLQSRLGAKKVLVVNTHLHASYRITSRRRELKATKKRIHELDPNNEYIQVVGGDFNNLFYGEKTVFEKLMKPEFVNCTDFGEYTCDTRYIEHFFLPTTLQKMLQYFDLSWKTKIDHIFVDEKTIERLGYDSGAYSVVASDHRPVYVKFKRHYTKPVWWKRWFRNILTALQIK